MEKIDFSKAKRIPYNILAKGEISNHSHVVTGNADVYELDNELYIQVHGTAFIKHLLETDWVAGIETWTREHTDIELPKGTFRFIQQKEYNPYLKLINSVKD